MAEKAFQVVNRLRKSGDLAQAWEVGSTEIKANPNDQYLKGAFFWVCYEYIKEVQTKIKSRAETNQGDQPPGRNELERINYLLDCIIWLDIPPGGFEYRSLLLVCQRNLEYIPRLVLLLVHHADKLFSDEDALPFVNEKGESPSLMLKFGRKVARAWMLDEGVRELTVDEVCALFSKIRSRIKDTKNQIWLDYDEAKLLIAAKRPEAARTRVLAVLRRKQSESWAWGALAATYRYEDPDAAVVLFSKALVLVEKDDFALRILKGFAPLLAQQGYLSEASMCTKRAMNCYIENGWNIKADIERLTCEPWYTVDVDLSLFTPFLVEKAASAMDYLFGEREQKIAIVENIHKSGKGFHVFLNRKESISVRQGVFSSNKLPALGDFVVLTISTEDRSVIEAKPSEPAEMDDAGYQEGALKINERGFGFVEDVFVPHFLIRPDMEGQQVLVTKILGFDKSKNKFGWKAIKVIAI